MPGAGVAAETPDDGFLHLENAAELHVVIDREGIDLGVGRIRPGRRNKGPGQGSREPAIGARQQTQALALKTLSWPLWPSSRELTAPSSRPIDLTVEKRTVDIIDIEALRSRYRLVPMAVGDFSSALWLIRAGDAYS